MIETLLWINLVGWLVLLVIAVVLIKKMPKHYTLKAKAARMQTPQVSVQDVTMGVERADKE